MPYQDKQDVLLSGEVVEVYKKRAVKSSKVYIEPFYLSIEDPTNAHLGERLVVQVEIVIKRVQSSSSSVETVNQS